MARSILCFAEISEQKHETLVTKNSFVLVALKFRMQVLIRSYEVLLRYAHTYVIGNVYLGFGSIYPPKGVCEKVVMTKNTKDW